jgi:hypothetical protein
LIELAVLDLFIGNSVDSQPANVVEIRTKAGLRAVQFEEIRAD